MKPFKKRLIKNSTLWFYLLAALCLIIQLLAVEYHFNKISDINWLSHLNIKTISNLALNLTADVLILMLPYVALKPKWRKWQWLVMFLVTIWCLAQFLYMPTYRDMMPLSSFLLAENVGGTLIKSTAGAFRVSVIEVLLPPILLYIVYRIWFKHGIENSQQKLWKRTVLALVSLIAFAGIRLGVSAWHYHDDTEAQSFQQQLTNDYCVMWTKQGDYVNINGVIPYNVYCAYTSIFNKTTLSPEEKKDVIKFMNDQPKYNDDDFSTARGKNVILIVVESLNSWVIDLKLNSQEVTPTLNALCQDTVNNLVCTKMKSQVKNGRSSDGIFMYNTGLLPLTTQAVANTFGDVPYPTIAKSLGEYDTFYACCDEPSLWDVRNTSKNYGYNQFYGKDEISDLMKNNGYKLDKALLDEVSELLPKHKSPFLALVATAGMHHPYNSPMEPATWVQNTRLYTPEVRCYLECCNAFDNALSEFIEKLKSQGLFENTMIVIVSDHNEMVDDSPKGRPSIDVEGDNCVFIALNSGQNGLIEGPIGQIDIYPTLIDLMGLNDQKWRGLGYSILRNDIHSVATAPSAAAGSSPLLSRQQQAWRISEMIIKSRWYDKDE